MGPNQPRGLNNLAMVDKICRLVLDGNASIVSGT